MFGDLETLAMMPEAQLANKWFFILDDFLNLDFSVNSVSLGLPSLNIGTTPFGLTYAAGMELGNTFSITFRENVNWSSSNFFINWMNEIYDFDKKCFKLGFSQKVKSASLLYYQEYSVYPYYSPLGIVPTGGEPRTTPVADAINATNSIMRPTKLFRVAGLMPTGIGEIEADVESGEPLEFTVEFVYSALDGVPISTMIQNASRQMGEVSPPVKFISSYINF
jgi:hypothetical protein